WNATPSYQVLAQPNVPATVTGTFIPARDATPGQYPIVIPVVYNALTHNVSVTVNVPGPGVTGFITPNPGTPASSFVLTLFNSGTATDTFNLSIVGPLSQAASIASNVTLAAGAQQNIPITLNPAGYLVASNVLL